VTKPDEIKFNGKNVKVNYNKTAYTIKVGTNLSY